jgi:hypothetical protein
MLSRLRPQLLQPQLHARHLVYQCPAAEGDAVMLHGSQHMDHGHLQAHQQRQQIILLQRKGRKQ